MTLGRSDENRVHWEASGRVLPLRRVERGSRVGGLLALLFGLAWAGGLIGLLVIATLEEGPDLPKALMLLLFALPGAFVLYFGLGQLVGRYSVRIDGEAVTVIRRGVRGETRWREPLSAYAGVLREANRHDSEHGASYTDYRVLLAHRDPERQLELFRVHSPGGWEEAWRGYAELLGLPRLEERAEGIYRADGGGEIATETLPFDPAANLRAVAWPVDLHRDGTTYEFRFSHYRVAFRVGQGLSAPSPHRSVRDQFGHTVLQ